MTNVNLKNKIGVSVEQCVMCPEDQYTNTEQSKCIQKSVIILTYEDPLGMALALTAFCFSSFTAVVLWVFVKHHDTPIVKASNRVLTYLLLISLLFCFLCSVLFIGHPNRVTCNLHQITFGNVFTVAVSTVLAKAITAVLAFKVTAPGKQIRYFLVSGAPNYLIPKCSLFQCIVCAIWLGVSPQFIDKDGHSENGHTIIICNKGSAIAFHCILGYLEALVSNLGSLFFLCHNIQQWPCPS
ncbi:vomeronasal type-2 receptor 116-like [Grammomys surdaster]|uniref:vomeronasal type-2 receptor 116-like n=1 Tax=Grammomys surdaster TaxID=491861 RepID=UPI00109F79D8|nr:vomeronasal type-2 receptor 116-like [Grammomys surdaster]